MNEKYSVTQINLTQIVNSIFLIKINIGSFNIIVVRNQSLTSFGTA